MYVWHRADDVIVTIDQSACSNFKDVVFHDALPPYACTFSLFFATLLSYYGHYSIYLTVGTVYH